MFGFVALWTRELFSIYTETERGDRRKQAVSSSRTTQNTDGKKFHSKCTFEQSFLTLSQKNVPISGDSTFHGN